MRKRFKSLLAALLALTLVFTAMPAATSAAPALREDAPALSAGSATDQAVPANPQLPEVPAPEVKVPEMKMSDTGYIWMEHVGGTSLTDAYLAAQADGTAQPQDTLPAYYNSNTLGYVTPIRDQNPSGSCWAHAPIASIETYMIKHGIVNGATGSAATTSMNLSESHLAWYAYTNAYDKLGMLWPDKTEPRRDHYLDNGGNGWFAAYTLMRGEGPASETESALAYSNAPTSGLGSAYAIDYNVAQVRDVEWIPVANRDAVKRAIMEYGAGSLSYYHADAYCNYSTGAYCFISNSTTTNHAVTVVGWDDNYAASNFNSVSRPNNKGAWIIKNSWGSNLGDHGYFYISYEDTACAASDCFFFRVDSGEDFEKIYQYDGTTCTGYFGWYSGYPLATTFRSGDQYPEELKSVALCTWDENISYNLKIYVDVTDENDPTSGTLALEQNGTLPYAGYHQILLDSTVVVFQDRVYSLVFTLSGSQITVALDFSYTIENYVAWTHGQRDNSCFYYSGVEWVEDTDENFRMKAYTSPHYHDFVITEEVPPTCTEYGYYVEECWCGMSGVWHTRPLGHDYSVWEGYQAPTCTKPGGDRYACVRCGAYIYENEEPPLGHDWVESWYGEPGCTTPGVIGYVCSRCGETKEVEIPPSGHGYYEAETVAPTCTERGYTLYVCGFCGASYKEYTEPLGHSWNEGVVTVEPTETQAGEKLYTCTRCGATKTEMIPALGWQNPFVDVKEGKWYYNAVLWAYNHDPRITAGTDGNHFSPNATCTRAQVVTFLWNGYGAQAPAITVNPFNDVKPGKWYTDAVLWAYYHTPQITGGMNATTFGVNSPCTRAQVVMFLWAAAGKPAPAASQNPFSDVKSTDYFYSAVLWAVENGITSGTSSTTFSPKTTCTRAQIVTFLFAALG